ncbi:MAG: DUF3221 domain-containing protein [Coriobacteriia bacterium]|nr:DUF3221 domain-containing protein [Actinomycetota bacterium]MDZ4166955.1 DUF3221 domain-containing protein [Coriobacteriia bacterium]
MTRPAKTTFGAFLLALALATALGLGGCTSGLPAEDPSIRGEITTLTPAPGGGSLLIEAPDAAESEYDKASVWITGETTLRRLDADGSTEPIEFGDLAVGQTVDVWFEGPVAESYPVQASAETLLLRP